MKKHKTVLVYGWFGHENLGDELILKSIIESIKKIDKNITVNVMGSKPKSIIKYHTDINIVSTNIDSRLKSILRLFKYNPINVIRNIIDSDYLIIGSGGALSDWNPESTISLFFIINLFKKILKRPVAMLGVGAGPITKNESKIRFKQILQDIDFISLRDVESYNLLKSIGLNNIHLTDDVVFDLKFDSKISKNIETKCDKNLGVVVAPLFMNNKEKYETYKHSIIDYIEIMRKKGYKITLIPFQYNYDIDFLKEINEYVKVKLFEAGRDNMWSVLDIMRQQDIIIGMRFHSVVVSLLLNVPVIPIIYHSKVYSVSKNFNILDLAQEVGDGANWQKSDINVEKLCEDTAKLYSNLENQTNNIVDKLQENNNSKNLKLLREFLE